MTLRKVLLVTYHFPPSGAVAVYRMLGLARFLPKYGWQPIVVAPPRMPWEPEDTSLMAQVPPETVVERVPFAAGPFGKIARYFAPEAHWLYKAWPVCERLIATHKPAAIITSSPPGGVHRLGLWIKRKYALPWIACFRDPWITNRNIEHWTLQLRFERSIEPKVMRQATTLIANTPLNQKGWEAAFPDVAHKIVTIPNGFDPERFAQTPETDTPGDTIRILHAGELYSGRDPRPFLDALAAANLPSVHVDFLGRATEGICNLPKEIQQRQLGANVHLIGQVPYAEALQRIQRSDILLLVHTPGYRVGVPAKLYEYLGAGRPILALAEPDGDIAWVLGESKILHRLAAPMDVAAIKHALIELVHAVQAGEPAAPDPSPRERFTREHMARTFAECLNRATSP